MQFGQILFTKTSVTHPQSADGADGEAAPAEAARGEGLDDGVVLVAHWEAGLGGALRHPLPVDNHLEGKQIDFNIKFEVKPQVLKIQYEL